MNSNTLKKRMLRDRTDRTWFFCLLRHPARKWGWFILTTPEPARAIKPLKTSKGQPLWKQGFFTGRQTVYHSRYPTNSVKVLVE